MTIQDPKAYVAGIWNWGILKGCFGDTKIEPTDLDGFVERNGQFLILEAKAPDVSLTKGQAIAFERLVEDSRFTVIVMWGETNEPEKLLIMHGTIRQEYKSATLETLRDRVRGWFKWADEKK